MSADPPPDVPAAEPPGTAPDVLVICTANMARSPLLQVRLQAEADRRAGPGAIAIDSAGADARYGDPAASGSRRVAERWRLSLDAHASKPAMYVPLERVLLILTMTRSHVRALTARNPGIAGRAFTVPELLACLDRLGQGAHPPAADTAHTAADPVRARLAGAVRLADAHRPAPPLWQRRTLDIADPLGAGQQVFDRLGERFEAAADALGEALFGPAPD